MGAVADVAYNTIVTAENIGLNAAHMAVDAGKFATGWAVGMIFTLSYIKPSLLLLLYPLHRLPFSTPPNHD